MRHTRCAVIAVTALTAFATGLEAQKKSRPTLMQPENRVPAAIEIDNPGPGGFWGINFVAATPVGEMALRLNSAVEIPRIENLGWDSLPSTETRRFGVWRAISVPLSILALRSASSLSTVSEIGTSCSRWSRF